MALSEFVNFLDQNNLIEKNKIKNDDDDGFSNRLRIQKYVFLSKYFGLELCYPFDMHLHGPYSKALTDKYYHLPDSAVSIDPSSSFHAKDFLNLFQGKDDGWLELAATLLHKKGTVEDDVLLEHVAWIKCDFTSEQLDDVYSDLQCSNLL